MGQHCARWALSEPKSGQVGTIGGGCGQRVDLDTLSYGKSGRFLETIDKIKGSSGQLGSPNQPTLNKVGTIGAKIKPKLSKVGIIGVWTHYRMADSSRLSTKSRGPVGNLGAFKPNSIPSLLQKH